MGFELPEEEHEEICRQVFRVFDQLGEKSKGRSPSFKKEYKIDCAAYINKWSSADYRTVHLSPDRNIEQRVEHRELVLRSQTDSDTIKEAKLVVHRLALA